MCTSVLSNLCASHAYSDFGGQKRALDALELEFEQMVVRHPGILRPEPRSFASTTNALNHSASLQPAST